MMQTTGIDPHTGTRYTIGIDKVDSPVSKKLKGIASPETSQEDVPSRNLNEEIGQMIKSRQSHIDEVHENLE